MTVEIKRGVATGKVTAPPSKSMAHRNLICGAFSKGSKISGVAMSKDIEATLSCLEGLGARVEVCGDEVSLGGLDFSKSPKTNRIFCNESGSTLRFLIPICLLFSEEITLYGSPRLFQRPLDVYEKMCRERGLSFEYGENEVKVKGPLKSGVFHVRGDVSSQFISGLLFALPHLEGNSEIKIVGELESASYIDLTLSALSRFGVKVERPDEKTFAICGGQSFASLCERVEGDYSNAAFFEALNRIGGSVTVEGLDTESLQGDRVYSELFDRIEKRDFPIDITDCPDLAPILFAVAAAKGRGEFTGTRRLKLKESDRALVMKEELAKVGAEVTVEENSVTVFCGGITPPTEKIKKHNDHRIVMSMAVLCTLCGGTIDGVEDVSKSFPDFFERLKALGIEVTEI